MQTTSSSAAGTWLQRGINVVLVAPVEAENPPTNPSGAGGRALVDDNRAFNSLSLAQTSALQISAGSEGGIST